MSEVMVSSSVVPERGDFRQVTNGSFAHHFGSREGLVREPIAERSPGLSLSRRLSDIDPDLDPETATPR
jgi:hypothetical protein